MFDSLVTEIELRLINIVKLIVKSKLNVR